MMRNFGGGALAKRKQKKKAKKGGRVTPKGPGPSAPKAAKVPFQLPGLN
jgi:hypothetical protein